MVGVSTGSYQDRPTGGEERSAAGTTVAAYTGWLCAAEGDGNRQLAPNNPVG